MSKKYKFSPWFTVFKKPKRKGVYQMQREYGDTKNYYSYWDGKKFRGHWDSVNLAYEEKNFNGIGYETTAWRGIVK